MSNGSIATPANGKPSVPSESDRRYQVVEVYPDGEEIIVLWCGPMGVVRGFLRDRDEPEDDGRVEVRELVVSVAGGLPAASDNIPAIVVAKLREFAELHGRLADQIESLLSGDKTAAA